MEVHPRPRDVAVPAGAFTALRRALRSDAGPLVAVHALQSAGYQAGVEVFESLSRRTGTDLGAISTDAFWDRLSDLLRTRGWGTLEWEQPHPGVGLLSSPDWAEAGEDDDEAQPACSFSAGMLSALLTRAAGGPVAVLQVACRGRGDDRCVFAFGAEATIHRLYGLLVEDRDLGAALAEL